MKDMNEFEGDVELLVNGTETLFIDGSNLAKVHSSKFQSVFKNEDEVETESGIKIGYLHPRVESAISQKIDISQFCAIRG